MRSARLYGSTFSPVDLPVFILHELLFCFKFCISLYLIFFLLYVIFICYIFFLLLELYYFIFHVLILSAYVVNFILGKVKGTAWEIASASLVSR